MRLRLLLMDDHAVVRDGSHAVGGGPVPGTSTAELRDLASKAPRRECIFSLLFFATSSFVPKELKTLEPPALGKTFMVAFGGKCAKNTLGPCGFTLLLTPVKLNLHGRAENGRRSERRRGRRPSDQFGWSTMPE